MRWDGGRESGNIEDRRGISMGGRMIGGGLGTVAIVVIGLLMGVDPATMLDIVSSGGGVQQPQQQAGPVSETPAEARQRKFVSVVLAETEDTWGQIFADNGSNYAPPKLVLYSDAVQSACGVGQSAMGPYYCPGDRRVYLDLRFLGELSGRFGAPGEFAQAYVIAHEIGHHVQNITGTMDKLGQKAAQSGAQGMSVRIELQADCYAGIWARHTDQKQHILEDGDIEGAMRAASAVGDDRLQHASRGRVVPDSFTHGTSAQRMRWFKRGFDIGNLAACDTFSGQL